MHSILLRPQSWRPSHNDCSSLVRAPNPLRSALAFGTTAALIATPALFATPGLPTSPTLLAAANQAAPAASAPDAKSHPGWSRLGDDLLPAPDTTITTLSVSSGGGVRPVLSLSGYDSTEWTENTEVRRWTGTGWTPVGGPLPAVGGSVTVDKHGRAWLCTAGVNGAARRGPVVWRWTGSEWSQLGGDVSVDAGYAATGRRHLVRGCSGPVFDSTGTPIVMWVAKVGSKADFQFVARWNGALGRWVGLEPGPQVDGVDSRAEAGNIARDGHDRLYVAAYRMGRPYSSQHISRVYRWDGNSWTLLGQEWEGTDRPVVVAGKNQVYVAYRDRSTGRVEAARWKDDRWQPLPSLGAGGLVSLGLSRSGRLVAAVTYEASKPTEPAEPTEPTAPAEPTERAAPGTEPDDSAAGVRVSILRNGAWHAVGGSASGPLTGTVDGLALTLDRFDRPIVAWAEGRDSTEYVSIARYSRPVSTIGWSPVNRWND